MISTEGLQQQCAAALGLPNLADLSWKPKYVVPSYSICQAEATPCSPSIQKLSLQNILTALLEYFNA